MATPIQLKHSSQEGRVPDAGVLANGELAINTKDVKAYIKNSDGQVVQLAGAEDGRYVQIDGDDTAQEITGTGGLKTAGLLESEGGLTVTNGGSVDIASRIRVRNSNRQKAIWSDPNFDLTTANADYWCFTAEPASEGSGNAGTLYGYHANFKLNQKGSTVYGFHSGISRDYANHYGFFSQGTAPNFFQGNTYIGGTTADDTFSLWKSTLTEEQLEQLKAGKYAVPANVTNPGNGEYARAWYYDRQDAETQALLDSGELEYPARFAAATFTDTFALGDDTGINLQSDGNIRTKTGGLIIEGSAGRSALASGLSTISNTTTDLLISRGENRQVRIQDDGKIAISNKGSFPTQSSFFNGSIAISDEVEIGSTTTLARGFSYRGELSALDDYVDNPDSPVQYVPMNCRPNTQIGITADVRGFQFDTNDINSEITSKSLTRVTGLHVSNVNNNQDRYDVYGIRLNTQPSLSGQRSFAINAPNGAPSWLKGSIYIGGDVARNTLELWKSTLTEEQLEQLEAGTLAIPETVSDPDNGFFARHWYYNQQNEETQALLDSGELKYPAQFAAETFTDSFTLGVTTNISLGSNGQIQARTLEFTNSGDASRYNYRGIGFSNLNNTLDITNHPNDGGENVVACQSKVRLVDSEGNDVDAGDLITFRARTHVSGDRRQFTGATGVLIENLATTGDSTNAAWSGDNDVYGVYVDIGNRTVDTKTGSTYNIYANGNAKSFLNGTTIFGADALRQYNSGLNISNEAKVFVRSNGSGAEAGQMTFLGVNHANLRTCITFSSCASSGGTASDLAEAGTISTAAGGGGVIFNALDGRFVVNGTPLTFGKTGFFTKTDARVFTNPTEITNAANIVKALSPKREGFIAHELQQHVDYAVVGTQNETEPVGTVTDYDGTVLQTNTLEPHIDELSYEEEVTDPEGVSTTVVRTKTWTATGTRPVHQAVDQTKLIPILCKALQEALERIEVLEAAAAG